MKAQQKIAVIDYDVGNVWSVLSAVKYLGMEPVLVDDPDRIHDYRKLILPGVGSYKKAMQELTRRGFDKAIREAVLDRGANILGICLGMQLLGAHGVENGDIGGLGLVDNRVEQFSSVEVGERKLPHVGFNEIKISECAGLFKNLPPHADFYFTHSYRMLFENIGERYATCSYGIEFLAAFEYRNIYGTQFHPEKSQTNGLILLKNYLNLVA